MKVLHSAKEIKHFLIGHQNKVLGFVPTMGALHDGHLALVKKALLENDIAVVSIFVNPTQFNNSDDLEKYPRALDKDVKLLKTLSEKNIVVFAPDVETVYGKNVASTPYNFDGLELQMEGKYRPGHFDGVATIVKYLFELIEPNNAYFGEKDFQQLLIVKKLVTKQKIPVNIIGCPIHREKDGLAMSSRNKRLSKNHRKAAPFIYKILVSAKEKFGTKSAKQITEWVHKQLKSHPLLALEYFVIADIETLAPLKRKSNKKKYRAFIVVYAGDVRLIDNIALN